MTRTAGTLKNAWIRRTGVASVMCCLALAGCSGPGSGPADDPALAREMVRDQRALDPTEPYWLFRMGELEMDADRPGPAHTYLDSALALDPDYAPAAALVSKIRYEAGQFEAAATELREFLARNPDAPDAIRVALALNLQALEDPESSATMLNACDDQSGPVRTARTFAHLQSAEYLDSLDLARDAVEDDPRSAANHNNLGISLLYAGQPEEARVAFLRALELDPDLPGALYNLAIVENFYFYDLEASRKYFLRYRTAAADRILADPDDLASTLGVAPDVAGTGTVESDQALLTPEEGAGNAQ